MNQPVDKMVIQYFRWRCELLDNGPIQDEFSKDSWKWWKILDGYYDLYGEMIQLPRWMCYDQMLTMVKEEFVKVTIQWNCRGLFSKKFNVFVQFSVSCIFLCTFLYFCFTICWRPTTKRNENSDEPMNQPVDKMMNQYFRWRCELLENSPIQGEFSEDNWKWWKMRDGYYDVTI